MWSVGKKEHEVVIGKIVSVVKKKGLSDKYFKLVYAEERCDYELCKVVMSTKGKNVYKVKVVIVECFYPVT